MGAPPTTGMHGTAPTGAPTSSGPGGGTATMPPGAAPVQQNGSANGTDSSKSLHQKGRSKIPWSKEVWDRIDHAVEQEVKRTRIWGKILPKRIVPAKTTSVPTDSYSLNTAAGGTPILTVDEGATTRLNEYYVEFELTPQQVDQEEGDFKQLGHSTAVTLATKAANTLALAEDLIVSQGQNAITGALPFTQSLVLTLNGNEPADTGLLNFPIGGNAPGAGPLTPAVPPPPVTPVAVVTVPSLGGAVPGVIYGPNTFEGVSQAYSQLQALGHYGPYALVLETIPYADTFAPLPATLTLTADRIKPLVPAGFYGTGTLPPNPANPPVALAAPFYGILISLGGSTADLVTGLDPFVAFVQEDTNGNFRFRVLQRFAFRGKDPSGWAILKFTA